MISQSVRAQYIGFILAMHGLQKQYHLTEQYVACSRLSTEDPVALFELCKAEAEIKDFLKKRSCSTTFHI